MLWENIIAPVLGDGSAKGFQLNHCLAEPNRFTTQEYSALTSLAYSLNAKSGPDNKT